MPYRAPNAYARFVRTAGPVNNPGSTRIMGLIGTGLNYYEIYNESIRRDNDRPYDVLSHDNVFEILSVSSKPVYFTKETPDNIIYEYGDTKDYILKDKQNIAWKILDSAAATVKTPVAMTEGAKKFLDPANFDCKVDVNNDHYVEDGEWLIEITYVHPTSGAYRVINSTTKEIVGEYAVESSDKYGIIPGCSLKVASTFSKIDVDGEDDETNSYTKVGDYILIQTVAGKTEIEASFSFDTTATGYSAALENVIYNDDLVASREALMIVDSDLVKTGTYDIKITDIAAKKFSIIDSTIPASPVTLLTDAIVGTQLEYLNVIPGMTFALNSLPTGALVGDLVRIKTVARTYDSQTVPAEGDVYYISYKYRKAEEDYDPKLFFDYDDVVDEYGNYDVTATGIAINSLSLGAEIAFQNGVTPIVCVQAKNDSDFEIRAALDKLKKTLPGVDNINTIVPLTDSPYVGAYAVQHVNLMSSEEFGKERMVYLGASRKQPITKNATLSDKRIGMVETAKSYSNERVVYVVPGEIIREVRDLRTGKVHDRPLPACYAAVAVASLGLINDPAEPLTRKNIIGFKELSDIYMESEKNFLAAAGCCVLDQRGNMIRVRHGITTSTIDVNSTEITLIQIKDYVIDACRKSCGELYVGLKNRPSVVADIQYTITSILKQFISQEVIIGFSGLSVKRSKEDPRQVDVRFEIEAVYPLNYINISFGFSSVS